MKTLISIALGASFSLILAACSSSPNKVKELDTEIDAQGGISTEPAVQTIGLNKEKEPVVQQLVAPDQEIKDLEWKQYDLEHKISSQLEILQRCYSEVSDPRLGGTGKFQSIPDLQSTLAAGSVKEEVGLTHQGDLKIVKTEILQDRMKREKGYLTALQTDTKNLERLDLECETQLRSARVSHGLPGERYQGVGQYVNGKYVQTRRPEYNLDDAFQIASEEAAQAKLVKSVAQAAIQ